MKTTAKDNYASLFFHTGAFAGPELFEFIPLTQNKLAGDKPNKVHGKKNLEEILNVG